MMSSIFENAKFGDKFITRDGRKAIVINLTPHYQGLTMALTIEDDKDAFYRFYHEDGTAKKEAGDTDAVDIVGKWGEPIDKEKVDKLASESFCECVENGCLSIGNRDDFGLAFYEGYCKGYDERK